MSGAVAVIVGASGGIGSALHDQLSQLAGFDRVIALGRPDLDLCDEQSIVLAAAELPSCSVRLVVNAAGLLHAARQRPEKSLRHLDPTFMSRCFAVNAICPALLMKHFLPLLPRQGRAVFASLSARVGSIADNRLGGWYSYRASKAALNQLVHTAAIELARTHPEAICVALHPGTVETSLSAQFVREGQPAMPAPQAAKHLLGVIERLRPSDSGKFFDWRGEPIPW